MQQYFFVIQYTAEVRTTTVNFVFSRLYTAFLHPTGRISHFFIPFHALSTSSSAERDLKTQARILQLVTGGGTLRPQNFVDSLVEELEAIRNIQLKTYLVSSLLTKEQHGFSWQEAEDLVSGLISRAGGCSTQQDKRVPLEQQLYCNKLLKLRQLIEFFKQLVQVQVPSRQLLTDDPDVLAALGSQLSVSVTYLETLLRMIKETVAVPPDFMPTQLPFWDFLLCFELEGELQASER